MEKFAIVVSEQDPASLNILEKINAIGFPEWGALYKFKEDIINFDFNKVAEEKVICLSRHKSEAGTKSLTIHHLGNFGPDASVGGEPKKLCGTLPQIGANYLRALAKKNEESGLVKDGFVVCMEVTHHGPFSEKSCLFIEIGSSEKDWDNELAGNIIAETILEETLKSDGRVVGKKDKVVIGLGGGHYAPDFTKLVLRQPYAFGHICPKYALDNLNEDTFAQMISKSGAEEIVLDWKGLKEWKDKVTELCKKTSLPVVRVQNLLGY